MRLLGKTEIDFLGMSRVAAALSALLVIGSIGSIIVQGGLRYGIDFAGGSQVIVLFAAEPDLDLLRDTLTAEGVADPQIQEFTAEPGREEVLIRTPQLEDGGDLLADIYRALDVFDGSGAADGGLDFNTVSREVLAGRLLTVNPLEFDTVVDRDNAETEYARVADLALGARDDVGLLST